MKTNKPVRYMIIKDGNISTQYSDDLMKTINEEYGYFYDTADNLFFEYPDIRVFVRDESLFSEKESVYYYQDGVLNMTFNGTVFFGKLGVNRPLSLSEREISFLKRNLKKDNDGIYHINSDMKGYLIRHYDNEWLRKTKQI